MILNICVDENYLPEIEIAPFKENGWRVRQLIDDYVRYLRSRKAASAVGECSPPYGNGDADDLTSLDLTNYE